MGRHSVSVLKYLDVRLCEQPRPVSQDLVELSQGSQLLRGSLQSVQPLGVSPDLQEVVHMQIDQVRALVPGSSLKQKHGNMSGHV